MNLRSPATTLRNTAIILIALLSSACTTVGLLAINTTSRTIANHKVTTDVSYSERRWQILDVYTPEIDINHAKKPVIIFFYGGAWDSGKKEQYLFAAEAYTSLGYVVVVPDYIKFPDGKFPQFVEDGAKAVAWTHHNIDQYGGDPDTIFLMGHSAGAHLAALLVADEKYLRAEGFDAGKITGFVGLAGPYNFRPKLKEFVRIFEPKENYPKMFVSNFIDGGEPPMLIARGNDDTTVAAFNQDILVESLKKYNVAYEDKRYDEVDHVKILLGLSPILRNKMSILSDSDQFFRDQISKKNEKQM